MPQPQRLTWQALQTFARRTAELAACIVTGSLDPDSLDPDSSTPDNEALQEAVADHSIVIVAGQGDIGAIGLITAHHLAEWDAWVQVLTLGEPEAYEGNAADALDKLTAADVPLTWAEDGWELPPCDLLIDAIGDGAVQPYDAELDTARKLIELANSVLAPILSVGMASEVQLDRVEPLSVRASHTITFD